ncbi:MAG TPA: histidine phosphatase family protein [Actinomycetota bacterium]|nr:histidine phosphatase family protein [Actinomycetota bacterium]
MNRRLLLIRHAKSSWNDASLSDRDRPLVGRGRKAAERMGSHLRDEGLRPDVVLCSPSRRTRETLDLLEFSGAEVMYLDELYAASQDELLASAREVRDDAEVVAVVGHNPGIQDLSIELASDDAAAGAVRLRQKFPTCAVAVFDVDGAWRDVAAARVRLVSFVVPKELP